MAATKAPSLTVLERFYSITAAAVRIGLRDPEDPSTKGEKVLRDGVNKLGWPHHRIGRDIVFSDSNLARIAELHFVPECSSGVAQQSRRTVRRRSVSRTSSAA
ncbi:hypothetical protein ACFY7H_13305 [Streptomyces sp. NPDC012794]|uniref:hypothetical protein n=1 Tax=Streptomyces sp. NPDC012794 TaxID=3364850 RepID=UPI0036810A2E